MKCKSQAWITELPGEWNAVTYDHKNKTPKYHVFGGQPQMLADNQILWHGCPADNLVFFLISNTDGNALLLGANTTDIQRLQRIQNWAAKLICRVTKSDHATPCLRKLHWLPIRERIDFKILTYVYKCLYGTAPSYLSSLFSLYRPTRSGLRSSSDTTRLAVQYRSVKTLKLLTIDH